MRVKTVWQRIDDVGQRILERNEVTQYHWFWGVTPSISVDSVLTKTCEGAEPARHDPDRSIWMRGVAWRGGDAWRDAGT